ncbi:hypothetical protein [Streptomyces chartreusis]
MTIAAARSRREVRNDCGARASASEHRRTVAIPGQLVELEGTAVA